MLNNSSILKQLHDRFDVYDRYPHTDHSVISGIAIKSKPNGYRITTYPGGIGTAYDGFAIDVHANGQMFEDITPTRAETSRDRGGLMELRIENSSVDDRGYIALHGTVGTPAAREGLILPEDEEFSLIEEMHDQIKKIREPLHRALGAAGMSMNPISFNMHEWGKSQHYDHKRNKTTRQSFTTYEVSDDSGVAVFGLDGTVNTNIGEEPSPWVAYSRGIHANHVNEEAHLPVEALIAFSGVSNIIKRLYDSRVIL
jgi:hypothetical protein